MPVLMTGISFFCLFFPLLLTKLQGFALGTNSEHGEAVIYAIKK